MRCSRCQHANLLDAKFCEQCGGPLQLACGACGVACSAGSRFCRRCGAALTSSSAEVARQPLDLASDGRGWGTASDPIEPDHYVPPRLAERFRDAQASDRTTLPGERKVITSLFADIKESMALLEGMDPDQAREVIDPALRLMMKAVYRYDGYVAKAPGDGIFAFFGAPIASEDHARRAIYAALSMQEQMKEYGEMLLRERGLPAMQIRVGINTGEVVVRSIVTGDRSDYSPIGHETGLAARIESVATPGSVFVSEATHQLTEGFFQFRDVGSVPLKGVSASVVLYEVTGIGPLRTRLEVSASRGLARFVGRQDELETIQAMWDLVIAGQGQVAAISGEAGVGKSRLCHEFRYLAKDDCLLLECSGDASSKAFPYLPLIDMLRSYLQLAPGDDDDRIREKVTARLSALDASLNDAIPFLLALLGVVDPSAPIKHVDPQIRRRRTLDAIQRIVLREARDKPVLMLIEDLHWLDDETRSFLTTFGRAIVDARVLLLVNYRPDFQTAWDATVAHRQVHLNTFRRHDAEALLIDLLGTDSSLSELKQLIIDKTEGNPFFIEEYVRTLFDRGVLIRGDTTVLTRAPSMIRMPVTVQGVLAARIDRLPPDQKAFLQMLAVLGMASPLRLIERMTQRSEAELQLVLDELHAADFIYERPEFPDVEYVFKHSLTRETAYGELLGDDRRGLHSRAAEAIEAHFGERLDDHCGELAHHYACSDNEPKAIAYLQRAGALAMQQSAYVAAIDHLTLALSLLPGLPDQSVRDAQELPLQSMLGSALMATRGFAAAGVGEAFERARDLCRDSTDTADLVRVLAGLGLLFINRGELSQARDSGEQLLSLAKRRQLPELLVSGHELLGLTLLRTGDLVDCMSHMEEALRLYDVARDGALHDALGWEPSVGCLSLGALAHWLLGYPDRAVAGSRHALRAAQAMTPRHPFSLAFALFSSIWVHQFRGETSVALKEAEAATEFATAQGFPTWHAHSLVVQGWAETELGNVEAGPSHIEQAIAAYETTGGKVWLPLFLLLRAHAMSRCGRTADALDSVSLALSQARSMGAYWLEAELFRCRGELLLAASWEEHATEAQSCFERASSIARQQRAKSFELRACISSVRLARRQGVDGPARRELASVFEWFTEGSDTADVIEARALLSS